MYRTPVFSVIFVTDSDFNNQNEKPKVNLKCEKQNRNLELIIMSVAYLYEGIRAIGLGNSIKIVF